jgi:hypothetical protein
VASDIFGISIEIWYAFAGFISGTQYMKHMIKLKVQRERYVRGIEEAKAKLRMLDEVDKVIGLPECQSEISKAARMQAEEIPWATTGCDLTDDILAAARDAGINPGEFLDNC